MTHVTCRLTAKNRNPTLGNRVWATFRPTFYPSTDFGTRKTRCGSYPHSRFVYLLIESCSFFYPRGLYYLKSQQVVNGANDDVHRARVSRLCPQVVLKICRNTKTNGHSNFAQGRVAATSPRAYCSIASAVWRQCAIPWFRGQRESPSTASGSVQPFLQGSSPVSTQLWPVYPACCNVSWLRCLVLFTENNDSLIN